MKIMLDIHGVADTYNQIMTICEDLYNQGYEIYVVSGVPKEIGEKEIKELLIFSDIKIKEIYSIVDIMIESDCKIIGYHKDRKDRPMFKDEDWDKVKGDLAYKLGITVVLDDTIRYAKYFPENTLFLTPIKTGKNYEFPKEFKKRHIRED